MENEIISLCMIIANKQNPTLNRLFRFADLQEGKFVPYEREANAQFYKDDIDNLYLPESDRAFPINTILLYKWTPFREENDDRWKQRICRSQEQWIEVLETEQTSCEQILAKMKKGYKLQEYYEKEHPLLFAS